MSSKGAHNGSASVLQSFGTHSHLPAPFFPGAGTQTRHLRQWAKAKDFELAAAGVDASFELTEFRFAQRLCQSRDSSLVAQGKKVLCQSRLHTDAQPSEPIPDWQSAQSKY